MPRTPITQLAVAVLFSALICSQSLGDDWKAKVTVDDFGDETGQRVIVNQFDGKMENTAVRGAKATARVLLFEEKPDCIVRFEMLDYGTQIQDFSSDLFRWSLSVKSEAGNITSFPLSGGAKQLGFSNDNDNKKLLLMLAGNASTNCLIEGTFRNESKYQYAFKIEQGNLMDFLKPMLEEELGRIEAERAMAAKKAEEERLAMELKREAEMQKEKVREQLISTPMIFKTKDGKFSVNGLYLASNSTHVRLKRVDNNTEVTVELKLLSEDTVEQIKARK